MSVQVGVIGNGVWGQALAAACGRAGCDVRIWGRAMGEAALRPVLGSDVLLLVVPTQALRGVCKILLPLLRRDIPVVACCKGIEQTTGLFVADVVRDVLPNPVAILSGPGFAEDVVAGLPTAVTLAADDLALAMRLADQLGSASFRLYYSSDVRGAEIGGAIKNVLAIACGIAAGRRLGASAVAALTARGFAEIIRFGLAHGAKVETLTGLSGLGDVILTCSSKQSRNYSYGFALGAGEALPKTLTEGVYTAPILIDLALKHHVDMPVCLAVRDVLDGALSVDEAVRALMARPQKGEH